MNSENRFHLEVFEPAMCCSSGVCGPAVNPLLIRFSSDLEWLKSHGIRVSRYNLTGNPDAFAANEIVSRALHESGVDSLPLILVAGAIVHRGQGHYPTREELARFVNLDPTDQAVAEPKPAVPEEKPGPAPACCDAGCACNEPQASSFPQRVLFSIILFAVVAILGVKGLTPKTTTTADINPTFQVPSQMAPGIIANPTASGSTATIAPVQDRKNVGEFISTLADLNKLAVDFNAVLLLIPESAQQTVSAADFGIIESARKRLDSYKVKAGLFSLRPSASEYASLVAKIKPPALLVMCKGAGMGAVPAPFSESAIFQAYIQAMQPAGGCGTGSSCGSGSSCGPSGCN